MRRLFIFSFFLLLVPFAMMAQDMHVLGYCDEDTEGSDMIGVEGEARISAAIRLPVTTMQRYKDGRIVRIRVAIRENVEKPSVWIRTSLNESSKVVQSISNLAYGWNEVTLNTPYDIDGSELYIGYTFTQPSGVKGVLAKGSGDENTSLVAVDNVWADYHDQGVGILYIQAIAEADLPQRDLAVIYGSADSLYYSGSADVVATAIVQNLGIEDMSGYTLTWDVDGTGTVTDDGTYGPLQPGQTRMASRSFGTAGLDEGAHYIGVTVSPVGGADDKGVNDSMRIPFYVYTSTYGRKILLEHFTSLPCVNCPPVDKLIESVVDTRSDVVWVAHHVGYRNDEFTIDASEPLLKFGVNGNPYIMVDRYNLIGDTPAFTISSFGADDLNLAFDMYGERQAFVSLTPSLTCDDGKLTASVRGESKEFFQALYPKATINVFIVEDDVLAHGSQAGDSNKKRHDNVLRTVLTRSTGDRITWNDDNTFDISLTADVDAAWDVDKLRVVAFVTAVADRDTGYPTGEVLNAAQATIGGTQGIGTARQAPATVRYYTIDGRPAAGTLTPGMYIVTDGTVRYKTVIR